MSIKLLSTVISLGIPKKESVTKEKINELINQSNGSIQLLGSLTTANGNPFNMNSTADQLIALVGGTKFIVTDVVIANASTSLTTAQIFEIRDAISRGGNLQVSSNPNG